MVGGFDWAVGLRLCVCEVTSSNILTAMACGITAIESVIIGQADLSMTQATWLMALVTLIGTCFGVFCRDVEHAMIVHSNVVCVEQPSQVTPPPITLATL